MAETVLALTCKRDDRIIFHKDGEIIGTISVASGKSALAFSFPVDIQIDRESLFRKKYPSLATNGDNKE